MMKDDELIKLIMDELKVFSKRKGWEFQIRRD